jgi:glycine/serine hydroxymethyltransferase
MFDIIEGEKKRQQQSIDLIPSEVTIENYVIETIH